MRLHTRLMLVALSAAILLSLAASTALALRSISVVGETTATATGRVSFVSSEGGSTVQCNITLVRTISSAIPKTAGILLGAIIDVRPAIGEPNCSSSTGTLNTIRILGLRVGELWRLFYESFTGTLPNIATLNTIVKNVLAEFELNVPIFGNIRCLYEEEEGRRGGRAQQVLTREGRLERFVIGANRSSRVRGSGLCPERGELSGSLTFSREAPSFRLV